MRFITPFTTFVAMLAAPVLSMPLVTRSAIADELAKELASLTLTSSYLQLYTAGGGASMDVDVYVARWTSFNEAATSVADGLAGVPALSDDDTKTVNGAFQTFSTTHVTTLGQLRDVAGSKLTSGGKTSVNGVVSSNRDKVKVSC
jgi:hypothetical protein